MRRLIRLLRYSTFGQDKFPISQEDFLFHETTTDRLPRYSTFGWDKFPISQEDFLVHEMTIGWPLRYSTLGGTSSLSPRKVIHPGGNNSSTTTVLISIRDRISTSQKELFIHKVTTRRLLQYLTLWRYKTSIFLKGTSRPWDDNLSTTKVLDPRRDKTSIF